MPVRKRLAPGRSTGVGEWLSGRVGAGSALMIDFDLNGRKVALDGTTVRRLRAKAKAEGKPVTLRRAEARALERLLDRDTPPPARP
jgi:hypothetical protein